jgi:hypothetical protein
MASGEVQIAGRSARQLRAFVRTVVHQPLWLAALGCEGVGVALHAVALHLGTLILVQPLLVMSVVFALPLRQRMAKRPVSTQELGWAVLLVVGLTGFLIFSTPVSAQDSMPDRGPAIAVATALAVGMIGCAAVAARLRGRTRALMLGVATGLAYAGTAALLKTVGNRLISQGVGSLLASWQLYALVAAGITGLVLNQLAFQSGPLAASLPAIQTVDPLASVLVGLAIYDEPLRRQSWALVLAGVGLIVVLATTLVLSRTGTDAGRAGRSLHPWDPDRYPSGRDPVSVPTGAAPEEVPVGPPEPPAAASPAGG